MFHYTYTQYPESAFKIATFDRWMVIVSGRSMVEELRKRGEAELSRPRGSQEVRYSLCLFVSRVAAANLMVSVSVSQIFQSEYIFEPQVVSDEYHVEVVREKLTRSLPGLLPGMVDEVVVASKDHIVTKENGRRIVHAPAVEGILMRPHCIRVDQCGGPAGDAENRRSHQQPGVRRPPSV